MKNYSLTEKDLPDWLNEKYKSEGMTYVTAKEVYEDLNEYSLKYLDIQIVIPWDADLYGYMVK